jgi:hypothetical protein
MRIIDRLVSASRKLCHKSWFPAYVQCLGYSVLVLLLLFVATSTLVTMLAGAFLLLLCIVTLAGTILSASDYVTLDERKDPIALAMRREQEITLMVSSVEKESFYLDAFLRIRGSYGHIRVVTIKWNPLELKTGDRLPDGSIALVPEPIDPCPARGGACTIYGDGDCTCALWDKWPSIRLAFVAAQHLGDEDRMDQIRRIGWDYQQASAAENTQVLRELESKNPDLFHLSTASTA